MASRTNTCAFHFLFPTIDPSHLQLQLFQKGHVVTSLPCLLSFKGAATGTKDANTFKWWEPLYSLFCLYGSYGVYEMKTKQQMFCIQKIASKIRFQRHAYEVTGILRLNHQKANKH